MNIDIEVTKVVGSSVTPATYDNIQVEGSSDMSNFFEDLNDIGDKIKSEKLLR